MKQFTIFVKKEFYHVFRDPKTLLLLFSMPIAQIFLFGFALTNEIKNSQIVISDYSNDIATTSIIQKFKASKTFAVQQKNLSHFEIEEAFKSGKVKLAIVFP